MLNPDSQPEELSEVVEPESQALESPDFTMNDEMEVQKGDVEGPQSPDPLAPPAKPVPVEEPDKTAVSMPPPQPLSPGSRERKVQRMEEIRPGLGKFGVPPKLFDLFWFKAYRSIMKKLQVAISGAKNSLP